MRELASRGPVETLLVVEKEENTIFLDGAAERRPELIPVEGLARHSVLVVEPIVGGEDGVPVELVQRAVKLIGAALGYERDLAARAASLIGPFATDGDAELLHRIQRYRQR